MLLLAAATCVGCSLLVVCAVSCYSLLVCVVWCPMVLLVVRCALCVVGVAGVV